MSGTAKPLLSVLIDTYNHEKYIEQALTSVIEQDFPMLDCEIVVIDDGSTDRTPEIVRKFAPRVRLLRKKNGGQASAFNAGIPETRGDIIAFLDGDDWFAQGKLTAVFKVLEQNPDLAAVAHGRYYYRDWDGGILAHSVPNRKRIQLTDPTSARAASEAWTFFVTSATAVRRRVVEKILPIPEALTFCADGPIALAAMAAGACVLHETLSYYRVHSANLSAVADGDNQRLKRAIDMSELVFGMAQSLLPELGVARDVARAFIRPPWMIDAARQHLAAFGGSRLKTLQTEMASFRFQCEKPTFSYRFFKYGVVAPATILFPPRTFYKMRTWYARQSLGGIRERVAPARWQHR